MPNTFAGYPLVDPREVLYSRKRFLRDNIGNLEYANALYVPGGRWPARGWILMTRAALNNINLYANQTLNFYDAQTNIQIQFPNLVVVQSRCVSCGSASDPAAIYLVEITDQRGMLWNRWYQFPTLSSYNVRSPAYPGQFYSATVDGGGNPWTWNGMIGDLWGQMSTWLGAYPGLPSAPSGTPEEYSLPGVSAWTALNDILDLIGVSLTVDLRQAAPYGLAVSGAADAIFTGVQTANAANLMDSYEWIDTGAGRVPGLVNVLCHRRNQYYGTEETVRRDSIQWTTNPIYEVASVAAPAQFANATGVHYLWIDYTVEFDINGVPLPGDVATANAIAQERVTNYFGRIYRQMQGFMNQKYGTIIGFTTGSLCDGVCWRQDMKKREGWITEVVRKSSYDPPWPDITIREYYHDE